MNKLKYKKPWNDTTDKLRQQLANLTDEDLTFPFLREEEILERLKSKVDTTKEELRKIFAK